MLQAFVVGADLGGHELAALGEEAVVVVESHLEDVGGDTVGGAKGHVGRGIFLLFHLRGMMC